MLEEKSRRSQELDKIITIVIPTLNEEQAIAKVIEELRSFGLTNILVVDGYSSDRTTDIAKELNVRVFYQLGKGKTGAIKTAINIVDTPFILVIDGDFTYDPSCIDRLIHHINSYDEVIGARVYDRKSMSRLHLFGNKIISKAFNLLMNTNLSDLCSGFYLLRTSSARELELETAGFDAEVEIAAQIASVGRITEIPVYYRPRLGRQKLSTWRHGFKIIGSVLRLARTYNPGMFYSMLGSLLAIPGGLMLFNSLVQWLFTGFMSSSWFFLGIAFLLVALQAMGVGIVSLLLRRTELRIIRKVKLLGPI